MFATGTVVDVVVDVLVEVDVDVEVEVPDVATEDDDGDVVVDRVLAHPETAPPASAATTSAALARTHRRRFALAIAPGTLAEGGNRLGTLAEGGNRLGTNCPGGVSGYGARWIWKPEDNTGSGGREGGGRP